MNRRARVALVGANGFGLHHRHIIDERDDGRLVQRLRWCDSAGATLLAERRGVAARPLGTRAWALEIAFALAAPRGREIVLGSPATNGRPGGSGYGGLFWRAPMRDVPPDVFTETTDGEGAANGSTEPWLALAGGGYSLLFSGLGARDRWFVRAADYPGVCAALAYEKPLIIEAGGALDRRSTVVVADGRLDRPAAAELARQVQGHP